MRRVVIGLTVVAVAAAGFAALRHRHPAATARVAVAAKPPTPSTASAPLLVPAMTGSQLEPESTEATVVRSGLALLELSESILTMSEDDALAAQARVSTKAAAPTLTARLRTQLAALRDGFGPGTTRQRVAPLAVRATVADETHATVALWYVAVVWTTRLPAYEQWRTVTYQLELENGSWLEAGEEDVPGPRPSVLADDVPSGNQEMKTLLDDFVSATSHDG